ncbi:unnamed protein product [Pleuronectes platessa]|uniref:LRRCT domain-containing protein n=1 Tax=Pleuronectes platessa TaxID=8262 RepID=A0A9N7V8G0_PLEPL|nr:unnamed protein product [Pleuronectes platessa]
MYVHIYSSCVEQQSIVRSYWRRNMDLPPTLHVFLLLCSLNTVVWACPVGCKCQTNKILCSGLSDFPTPLNSSTTALYVSNSSIYSLKPEDLAVFSNALNIFVIKDTVLKEVHPGTLDATPNIGALGFTGTELQDLPEALFQKLLSLESLTLKSNKLLMSLYENQLESLGPGVFGPMPLQELWLYDNKLSRLEDDTFRNLTHLRLLVLSRNQINYVSSGTFRGLEKVGEISLHTNLLTTLQAGTFQGLPSLVNISLEHNFITSLPVGFLLGVSHLGQIDLRNNSFNSMPQESLDALIVTNEVLLQQNPWRCDKDILPLRDWLRQHPTKANQTLVVCELPFDLNGEVIALLTNENLMPLSSTEDPVLTSTEKRRKPNTPPTRRSTVPPAVNTTPTSEPEEVTSSGQGEQGPVTNNIGITLIIIAVVSTVIISTLIVSCVCWRKNKRGQRKYRPQK